MKKPAVVHMDTATEDGLLCGNQGTIITATLIEKEVTCGNCLRVMSFPKVAQHCPCLKLRKRGAR